jgi:galactokinase
MRIAQMQSVRGGALCDCQLERWNSLARDSHAHYTGGGMISLADSAAARFAETFGRNPTVIAVAPGRVNFIGEHTDYNDGFVMPLAIDRHVVVAGTPNETSVARIGTSFHNGPLVEIDLARRPVPGDPRWANYVRGVIAGVLARDVKIPGFDGFFDSDLPAGGGLSSSAALEVATATLLESLTRQPLDPSAKALLCQRAEHDYAGVPCGIMDQFASVFGRENQLLLIDCRNQEIRDIEWPAAGFSLIVVNSGVNHELAVSEYAIRRRQCEAAAHALGLPSLRDATLDQLTAAGLDGVLERRARHVISENHRTLDCAAALERGDAAAAGRLMYASHASLRDDYEVSCRELDALVEAARDIGIAGGVFGARMTGGGFGGSAIILADQTKRDSVLRAIIDGYRARTGLEASGFVTRPADGARVLNWRS